MTSPNSCACNDESETLIIDSSDLANSGPFMDSLITLLNEASICMNEVKQRAGMSLECGSPVKMNDDEKQEKLKSIVTGLCQKCQLEISQNESSYHTAQSSGAGYVTARSMGEFSPPQASTPCSCPPDLNTSSASSRRSRGRRADTPRPGTSPVRGRVATPDNYFIPIAQSSMNSPSNNSQVGGRPCPLYAGAASQGRSTESPYSTLIDSGRMPGAYSSGPGAFDDLSSSQSGRGASNYPSSSFGNSGCPPECAQSVNSTGRQQYRRLRGQDPWAFREANRTA